MISENAIENFKATLSYMSDEQLVMIGMKGIVKESIKRGMFDKLTQAIKEAGR